MCFCTNRCKITKSDLGRTREGLRKLISSPIVEGILFVKNKNVDAGIERIGGGGGDEEVDEEREFKVEEDGSKN